MKRSFRNFVFLFISMVCWAAEEQTGAEKAAVQSFKLAPSYFIPNTPSQKTGKRLVDDSQVAAFVQTQNGRVLFTPSGAYIGIQVEGLRQDESELHQRAKDGERHPSEIKARSVVMKAGISSAHAKQRRVVPRLEEPTASRVNFMVGAKENWRTDVPTYRKLVYDDVWEGIRLEYLGFMDHLEFQLVLEPGSDPKQIAMETGGEQLTLMEDGRLEVSLAGAELVLSAPRAFQDIEGVRQPVAVGFKILENQNFGFTLGDYAPEHALVIDPTLTWSTYLGGGGGTGREASRSIAVDGSGNAFLTGYTPASDYPATIGAYDESWNGKSTDVFVSKLNSTGTALIYSTFLGGSGNEEGHGIAVDSNGNAYVTGYTGWTGPSGSQSYPTTSGAYNETINGSDDVFVSVLNNTGTALIYSTYLGGTGDDHGLGIALDNSGNAYVTGSTESLNYPTTSGAYDSSYNGGFDDVFVSKLNSTGTALIYSTYLGGFSGDYSYGIAVDSSGNAYVTGTTYSLFFPTTSGAFDESHFGLLLANGEPDAFVSKLNSTGTALIYSTFLGEVNDEVGLGIAVDSSGNAYVIGSTSSSRYPTTSGAYDESWNGSTYSFDAFVSKLNSTGSALSYSTFLGGENDDYGHGIAVDESGNVYVTGYTNSTNYPTTDGAYDESYNGSNDVFVSKLNSTGSVLSYSSFLGGSRDDYGYGIAVDSSGNVYVNGYTKSTSYPTTDGAYDESHNGETDAFVSKLNSSGTTLSYSTFLGGSSDEFGIGIAVDGNDSAYVTGNAFSHSYPTTSGAYDEFHNGSNDVFVSKLNSSGTGLSYSSFLGGSSDDYGKGIAVDSSGNVYVTGFTNSLDYPTTSGAYDESHNGESDVFVSKLNSSGTALSYSTFLGGSNNDNGYGIALDSSGNAYVTGDTNSTSYPTTIDVYDESHNGLIDVFVSKLNNAGTALSYSTFLGGSNSDYGYGIAVDSSGNAYVTGNTNSSSYPTTSGAYDEFLEGSSDVFVSKLNSSGSALGYSTYLGGMYSEGGYGIGVDGSGNAYVAGWTYSPNYPTTSGAYDESHNSNNISDAFVSKLNSNGTALSYSTYLGGNSFDDVKGIAVDNSGSAYVAGITSSTNFPTTSGAFDESRNGDSDVFVSKLNSTGTELRYSTYLGGSAYDVGSGIAVDSSGNAYVTGYTYSLEYPTTSGAYDETQNGNGDAFVSKIIICPEQPGRITGDPSVCANDAGVSYSINAVTGATGYTWSVPAGASIISGQGTTSITVTFGSSSGNVSVTADNDCGSSALRSMAVTLVTIAATPGSQGLGLHPPQFDVEIDCAIPNLLVEWRATPPTPMLTNGTGVTLVPPPSVTTYLQVIVTDGDTQEFATDETMLIIPVNSGYEDFNLDGCNNLQDLWDLAQFWSQNYSGDPDGDGFITLLDLMYLNVSDPVPCP